jgi:hypothetical protein
MAKLVIRIGLDSWPDVTMDNFIAAKISNLTGCGAPDISKNKKHVLNAFIMNHKLALSLNNSSRRLIFNFIRKVEIAFDEYCVARDSIIDYVAAKDQRVTPYFKALAHLENCMSYDPKVWK